jgi:signal transduction histidine kinase/ligand-binding sensor domain-containing protein
VKRFFIIAIILLQICYVFVCHAQQINIRTYSIEEGLVNNDVLNIYQDSHGFIWLCTRGGLSRYDGTRFTNYTTDNGLTNDMINDIYEIAPQKFIVAQNLEGPRLLQNGSIGSLSHRTKITLNRFYRVGNSRLLATTDQQGLVEWREDNFQTVNNAYTVGIQRLAMLNDSVWIIAKQNHFIQLFTPELKPYSLTTIVDATMTFTDSRHRTWVGTTKGIMLLDTLQQRNKNIVFIPLPPAFDLPILRSNYISDFMEDSRGNCWIATSAGLVQVQPNGTSNIFTDRDGLPSPSVNCLLEDRQNNIWIGTSLGLAKFSLNNEVKIFTQKEGLPLSVIPFISSVTESRIRLFVYNGISELNLLTGKFSNHSFKENSAFPSYRLSREELLLVKDGEGEIYKQGEEFTKIIKWPSDTFHLIVQVDTENFVGVSGNKLFTISNGNAREKLTLNIADKNIYVIILDKNARLPDGQGILWVGAATSGLYKIRLHRNQQGISFELIDSLITELPDRHIRALYADKKNELWIGTRYKGVIRLLELQNGKYEMQNYGTQQGLSSNFVRTINRDNKGNIWVGTMQGIDKLIPTKDQYRVFNFGKINKIFSQAVDICFLKDDYLLASGFPYLVYAKDKQQDTLPSPAVYITKVFTGLKDSISITTDRQTKLAHNKAQIYFEFSAPQFINEEFTEYSYRLLGGNDTNWTIAGKSHSIYFASLRPGNYTFEVRAMGFNGKWGQPAIHGFIVTTPFWQQAWFILLVIAAIALFAYALYRYRIQQLVRLQKVRNRIATDLHDEIGSNLTNISILSRLSKNNLSQPDHVNNFLQRISEEVSSSSQALDDIIWSVNTNHDTLEETVARMRRYAAELFDAANISYDLHLDPAFEEKKLIMEQRRDLYLLYKEAVNNIFKHADAKQVTIKIAIEQHQLVLHIKDDGKGFETGKESARYGLKGMKERVKKWKGKIEIKSASNEGVSIQIRLPVAT